MCVCVCMYVCMKLCLHLVLYNGSFLKNVVKFESIFMRNRGYRRPTWTYLKLDRKHLVQTANTKFLLNSLVYLEDEVCGQLGNIPIMCSVYALSTKCTGITETCVVVNFQHCAPNFAPAVRKLSHISNMRKFQVIR
jgi:hypothetical protein